MASQVLVDYSKGREFHLLSSNLSTYESEGGKCFNESLDRINQKL